MPVEITGAHVELSGKRCGLNFRRPPSDRLSNPGSKFCQPLRFSAPMLQFGPWHGSRHWFTSEDDVQLIQIQADRLIYNWRRGPNNATYPHFEALQDKFNEIGEKWDGFLANRGQKLRITQWEVSYINHILTPEGRPALADAVSFWGAELNEAIGGLLDAARLEAQRKSNGRRITLGSNVCEH